MGVKIRGSVALLIFGIVGCSRPHSLSVKVKDILTGSGSCNVIIGENAEYDPSKSFQVVIQPTSELQREYAISVVQRFIQDHPSDHECMSVYHEALRQLQFNSLVRPSKPGEKL